MFDLLHLIVDVLNGKMCETIFGQKRVINASLVEVKIEPENYLKNYT